jgi:arabinogalactan endo-1,4-beta-galactosidase
MNGGIRTSLLITGFALLAGLCASGICTADDTFYTGADISLLPYIESRGGVFYDNGQAMPLEQIMVNHGCNLFRLRIFVNPDTVYSHTSGAIQTLSYDLSLAQRIKAVGGKLLLDFHYSDTWADPGHQTKPAAWSSLSFTDLNSTLRSYTSSVLTAFKNNNVMPDIVQVGNEITNGVLWSDGSNSTNWTKFGQLVNSAIAGVRDAQGSGTRIAVAIHINNAGQSGLPQWFFSTLASQTSVTDYDIMGLSYYPSVNDTLTTMEANLTYLANNYNKKIMILETDYPWEGASGSGTYPVSPAGQKQFLLDLAQFVHDLPNNRGEGFVYWYPESIQVPNTYIWNGGAMALFDTQGNALPSLSAFGSQAPGAAREWIGPTNGTGSWSTAGSWNPHSAPNATNNAVFGNSSVAGTINITGTVTAGSITFNAVTSGSHAIAGGNLNLGVGQITVSAASATISSTITGSVGLTKSGAGTLVLTGSNTYTGATNILQGTLSLNGGDLNDSSPISVASGAAFKILSGTPTVGDIGGQGTTVVSGAGTVLTADSLIQGALTLGPGATLVIAAIPGGPASDQVPVESVPEPSAWAMLLMATAGFGIYLRRQRDNEERSALA